MVSAPPTNFHENYEGEEGTTNVDEDANSVWFVTPIPFFYNIKFSFILFSFCIFFFVF